jgi:hypothetical protein
MVTPAGKVGVFLIWIVPPTKFANGEFMRVQENNLKSIHLHKSAIRIPTGFAHYICGFCRRHTGAQIKNPDLAVRVYVAGLNVFYYGAR